MDFRFGPHRIAITTPDQARLLDLVGARLARGQGFALATLNLDHLVKLGRDADFAAAYAAHEFVVADGNPVVWLSRLGGKRVALVPGADLVLPLARLAAREGVAVALVGSTAPALALAAARLCEAAPGLRVALMRAPSFGFDPAGEEARAILAEVASAGAGLCLLALGAPRQERLAARGRALVPGVGFVSIGAGLDCLAGTQRRAPAWLRRLALEWLWRLATDPRRLAARYLAAAAILPGHAARALARRLGRR
ncbi:MAG: WecB/TagA/CpsF family glycosyltransferase [Rhodobacteraceae bacterium]|nr:WecB/TagA/CpsF family glycosyltransferase [Paracoccaceae bacterium]